MSKPPTKFDTPMSLPARGIEVSIRRTVFARTASNTGSGIAPAEVRSGQSEPSGHNNGSARRAGGPHSLASTYGRESMMPDASIPSTRTAARTWSNAGSVYTTDPRDRAQFNVEVNLLSWVPMGPEAPCPDMTALAVIAAYELQGVTSVATGGGLDYPDGGGMVRHGLLGVECASADGRFRFYVLDTGTQLIPLAWDFWTAGAMA